MKIRKKTKIVATLGPAIDNKEMLEELMVLGVNVFRVNFSHAEYDNVARTIRDIREINKKRGFNVAILADLQGPKLRVGVMAEKVKLKKGDEFIFTTVKCEGTKEKAYMTYKDFPKDVHPGEQILVDDGKLLFEVIETDRDTIVKTKVLRGGKLKSKKGVNLPNTKISLPALTKKDKRDVLFAIEQEVDWIALSFVRSVEDLEMLNEIIRANSDYQIPIIAKIEKPEAVENINHITGHCNGIMVARGDLGVEIPMDQVPVVQKKLVKKAREARIPVIIATQMMESMITSQVPTRAEVNDVANSIMDGADAVMLSGETSVGEFPKAVINSMRKIIESVEDSGFIKHQITGVQCLDERFITKSICHQAASVANDIDATAITTLTHSGYTAFQISAWRPKSNILAFTDNRRILAMLNLLWGVKAYFYNKEVTTNESIVDLNKMTLDMNYAKKGDFVINLSAMPVKEKGMVNTMRISQL
jgi:pyruvate kinase